MAGSNGKAKGGAAQAERHARRAKEKADARREQATGAAGWVADRAGDWSLEAQDLSWMDRQKYLWNPLMDYWFRMEIEGFEKLPEPPALLIGIHSGAPFVWDAWTVGFQWWRHFGSERPLHGTAHDALMAAPVMGAYFRKMGVLPAAPDSIAGALAAGRDVALWPGGEVDSLRPWSERDKAVLAGRTGFIRMAIQAGVPIVPIATVGGPDSMPVLLKGKRLAQALQLDKIARLKMFPIALQAPWGSEPRDPARDPAADEDPHGVPGPGALRGRPRAGERRRLRQPQVPRGPAQHPDRHGRARAAPRLPALRLSGRHGGPGV